MKLLVFLVCSGIGYLIGHFLGDGAFAAYASVLISYHLFLAYLVMSAGHKTGLSLPIGSTILTHLAFLAVVVCFAMGRHYIPFFGIIRLFVPALAPFETTWLFSGGRKQSDPFSTPAAGAPVAAPAVYVSTGEDYDDYLKLLSQQKRPTRKPGVTLKEEFEKWAAARAKSRAAAPSHKIPA